MEIKIAAEGHGNEQEVSFFRDALREVVEEKTLEQKAIRQTFPSTSHLANLLPAGTVLAFQLLFPIISNQGECDVVTRYMTAALVGVCGLSCFLQSFTDSFKVKDGNVCNGFATFCGLWAMDGSGSLPQPLASKYRLRLKDFIGALTSILVFAAIGCLMIMWCTVSTLYPSSSKEVERSSTSTGLHRRRLQHVLCCFPDEATWNWLPLSTGKDVAKAKLHNFFGESTNHYLKHFSKAEIRQSGERQTNRFRIMSIESAAEEGTPFLLPTGTVIAFKLLSPILSTGGDCDPATQFMTMLLVVICAVSCFLQCFTDSFRDKDGNVCYGFATVHGLWVIDGSTTLPPAFAEHYRLHFIDFVHAFASVLVFAAIALFDRNVVNCFYPSPSKEANEVLTGLPIMIGVICSMVFVKFPSKRRGIGFPVSPDNLAQR